MPWVEGAVAPMYIGLGAVLVIILIVLLVLWLTRWR